MKFYTNNSFAQMQACFGGQLSPDYPYKLYLDMTQDCNLSCKMCREGYKPSLEGYKPSLKGYKPSLDSVSVTGKTMQFDLFCKLVDETSPYIRSYSLFNWGEPLILKDFCERVSYVCDKKRPDCSVDISTNGVLLTDDMIDFLHSNKVNVIVSFDGADKDTFEDIRRGAKFEQVCQRIRALTKVYSDMPIFKSPEIYVSIQKENQNQLPAITELAYSMGVRRIGFGLVTAPAEYAAELTDDLRREIERTSAFIDAHGMLNTLYPTKVGDYLWWGKEYVHKDEFLVDTSCNAPLVIASIAYNGDVYLCCNGGDVAGNVCDKSFKEVWQSKRYNELREAVNSDADMPERCRTCTWFNR